MKEAIKQYLGGLKLEHRQIIEMKWKKDLSYQEMGDRRMSRRMDKEEFDHMFDQAFEEAVRESFEAPTDIQIENSWKRVEQRLKQEKRKRQRRHRVQMVSISAASLLLGALLLSPGQMTSVFQPMYKMIKGFQEGIATFFVQSNTEDHSGAKTPPPPDVGGILHREVVTLEEAQEKTSFHLFVPSTLPTDYALKRVDLFFREGYKEAQTAQLKYIHPNGDSFDIIQIEMSSDTHLTSGVNESSRTIQEIQVLGTPAYLVSLESGRIKLELLIENVKITIIGDLNKEEILNIATSIK